MTDFVPDFNPAYGTSTRTRRTGHTIRAYLTSCVSCRTGIYAGDNYSRGRGQLLGALCETCADKLEEKP